MLKPNRVALASGLSSLGKSRFENQLQLGIEDHQHKKFLLILFPLFLQLNIPGSAVVSRVSVNQSSDEEQDDDDFGDAITLVHGTKPSDKKRG